MRRAVLLRADDQPGDWQFRSALSIAPGDWRMRNGHTARIEKLLPLPYEQGGQKKTFNVWKGLCVECGDPLTWNINGTYAANGKHQYDIVGRV